MSAVQNSLARAVTRTPKSCHITPVLRSLHWLRINERIKYKLLSVTYKVLTTNQPQYLHNLISVQPCHGTRSSSTVTLTRPPSRSSLKITNRSFRYAAPCLWNELPTELRLPCHTQSSPPSPFVAHGSSSPQLLHHHHYLSLLQSFIPNLRLGFLANPFHHRPFPYLSD